MGLREYFQQDTRRQLVVICGLILLTFALLSGVVAMISLVHSLRDARAVFGTIVLGVLSWGLVLLALRLLRARPQSRADSLPPSILMVGAVISCAGGLLLIFQGLSERDLFVVLMGAAALPVCYFSLKFALEARKRAVSPYTSLERTREK
jgi:drug/metabolite transporter (DMT)-like permease